MENVLPTIHPNQAKWIGWITAWISRELQLDPAALEPDGAFVRFGMDSVHAIMLVGDLEETLGCRLSPTLAWDYPTIAALSEHLAQTVEPAHRPVQVTQNEALLARLDTLSEAELDALLAERLAVVKAE